MHCLRQSLASLFCTLTKDMGHGWVFRVIRLAEPGSCFAGGCVRVFDKVESITAIWYFGTRGRLSLDSGPGALKDGDLVIFVSLTNKSERAHEPELSALIPFELRLRLLRRP